MCLAAGAEIVGGDASGTLARRALKVEKLSIEAPLALPESSTVSLQTIVSLKNGPAGGFAVVEIHSKPFSKSTGWLRHVKATVYLQPTDQRQFSLSASEFLSALNSCHLGSSVPVEHLVRNFYESTGSRFGTAFRSVESCWKIEEGCYMFKIKHTQTSSSQRGYVLHPIIGDAMAQTLVMVYQAERQTIQVGNKICLPIQIGTFIWFGESPGGNDDDGLFVYVTVGGNEGSTATLINGRGVPLTSMNNVTFAESTVQGLEAIVRQQTHPMPDLWEETWRKTEDWGFLRRLPLEVLRNFSFPDEFSKEVALTFERLPSDLIETKKVVDHFVYLSILSTLMDCGWDPQINSCFEEDQLFTSLEIHSAHRSYFSYLMQVLAEEGNISKHTSSSSKSTCWRVEKTPPAPSKLKSLISREEAKLQTRLPLLSKVHKNMRELLTGSGSVHNTLFSPETQWEQMNEGAFSLFGVGPWAAHLFSQRLAMWLSEPRGRTGVYRILEIGAGTGFITGIVLDCLEAAGVDYEYTFTDLSPAFFTLAEEKFRRVGSRLRFRKLNIEEDPLSQGFCPETYDYTIISDTIQVTRNMCQSLSNVRMLLRPLGVLDLIQHTKLTRLTYVWGLLDGFWRYEDLQMTQNHRVLPVESWTRVVLDAGYRGIGGHSSPQGFTGFISAQKMATTDIGEFGLDEEGAGLTWVILGDWAEIPLNMKLERRLHDCKREVVRVQFEDGVWGSAWIDKIKSVLRLASTGKGRVLEGILYCWGLNHKRKFQREILQPLLTLTQQVVNLQLASSPLPQLVILVSGVMAPVEGNDLSQFPSSTLAGFVKCLKAEHGELKCKVIDVTDGAAEKDRADHVFAELWNDSDEYLVAFHGGHRYVPKLKPHVLSNNKGLELPPGYTRFQLVLPSSSSISDIRLAPLEHYNLDQNEVEIVVGAAALNLRDVLCVLKPSPDFEDVNHIGADFAGVVTAIGSQVSRWSAGDCVFGRQDGLLPSHRRVHQNDIIRVPGYLSLWEASTLPTVFFTAHHCLIDLAQITFGDTVLIHSGSGGVGACAIQLCRNIGANVICTAGSARKRNYLRKVLGIQHVFNSRDTSYADQIMKVTVGTGVSVVLNSLTSDGFKEATLSACAIGARFIEMSKLSIWTPEEVGRLRPDVKYSLVDITTLTQAQTRRLSGKLEEYLSKKLVSPLPFTRFDGLAVRDALRYLEKAKHIGKVVCVMPQFAFQPGELLTINTPLFNASSTYLVTGGLGGIGFQVAKWMLSKGAEHIILAGRSSPAEGRQREVDKLNQEKSANLIPVKVDVGDRAQLRQLLEKIKAPESELPPLRGIMHAAGLYADGLIKTQSWDKFESSFESKVDGSMYLHELTIDYNLEHFVLFSSITALLGTKGQSNYNAGNCFLDALAQYRRSIGLPALSLNWGSWSEVGAHTEEVRAVPGVKGMSNLQAQAALEYAMTSVPSTHQLSPMNMDFSVFCNTHPHTLHYIDNKKSESRDLPSNHVNSFEFWSQYQAQPNLAMRQNFVKVHIRKILTDLLSRDNVQGIEDDADLSLFGLDSLGYVEVKNALQALVEGYRLISTDVIQSTLTVNEMVDNVTSVLEEGDNSTHILSLDDQA